MFKWLKKKFDSTMASQLTPQVIDDEDEVGCEVEEETFMGGSLRKESTSVLEPKGEKKLIWGGLGVCEVRDEHMFEGLLSKVTDWAKAEGGTEVAMGTVTEGRDGDNLQNDVEKNIIQEKQTVGKEGNEKKTFYGVEEGTCAKNVIENIEHVQTTVPVCASVNRMEENIKLVQTTVPVCETMNRKEENIISDEISPKYQQRLEEISRDVAFKHEDIIKEKLSCIVSKDEEIIQELPRSSEDEEPSSVRASEGAAVTVESSQNIIFKFENITEKDRKENAEDEEITKEYQKNHLSEHGEISREMFTNIRYIGNVEESESCNIAEQEKIIQEYFNGAKDEDTKEERLDGITSGNEKIDRETLTTISRCVGNVEDESRCCSISEQKEMTWEYLNDTQMDQDTREKRHDGITSENEQIDKEILQSITSEYENVFTDSFQGITTKSDQNLGNLASEHKNINEERSSSGSIQCTCEDLVEVSANDMENDTVHVMINNPEETESKKEIIGSLEIELKVEQNEKDKLVVKSEALETGTDSPLDSVRLVPLEAEQHFTGTFCDLSCGSKEVTEKRREHAGNSAKVERSEGTEDDILKEWNIFRNIKCEVTQKADEVFGEKSLVVEGKQKLKVQDRQLNEPKVLQNKECEEISKEEISKELKDVCTEKSAVVKEKGKFDLSKDEQSKGCSSLENTEYEDMTVKVNEELLKKSDIHEMGNFKGIEDEQLKECSTFADIKLEAAVEGYVDIESETYSSTLTLEVYEETCGNFLTVSKIPVDLQRISLLYPSHFSTNEIVMVEPGQVNHVRKPHMVGLANKSDIPHFLHNPSLEQGTLKTYKMNPSLWQGIPDSRQGATSPRPLGTTLFNQLGVISNVLNRKYILTKVFGQLIIVEIRTVFMHLVPDIEYHSCDTKETVCGIPHAQLKPPHGLEKLRLEKLEGKREVIRIADVPEGTVVMFDAVVDMSQNDTGGFEAIVVWQGFKPALTVSPLNNSYIVLKRQEGCQAEIQAVYKAWTRIAVEFDGYTVEVKVRNLVIFYMGRCITKATLRRLKKKGIMFKANVYLLCRTDGTQHFLSTCVWCEGKPPQGVSLDFNTCYRLESDVKQNEGGNHQKLIIDYPAQISRGTGDKGAILSFIDESGIYVRIPLPGDFHDIFSSEMNRTKEMAVWINFQRIFSTRKIQEVLSLQTVPERMMVLPITLKCPLPACQLENGTVITKKEDIVFEASDEASDEEGQGLESINSRMLDICGKDVKGSSDLIATDTSGEREEEILGKTCATTRSRTQKASISTVDLVATPNTHPLSPVTSSVAVSPPRLQEMSIPLAHSSDYTIQVNCATSKLADGVSAQQLIPPSVVLTSSLSEAERPAVADASLPLAFSSPKADRSCCLDQSSLSSVEQHPLGQNDPLDLHSAVLHNQKAILRHYDKNMLALESDSEMKPFLIELKGQEHVVLHEKLIDINACEGGSTVYFDALWTGHKYEPILLWQGTKPCIVAHEEELLFFDVSALILSSSESYLVLQVQDGQHSIVFKVNLEKKKVFTRGGRLKSCVDPGRWALVHLKKKAVGDKFDWFLMWLTLDDNCVNRHHMDPAFVSFMLAEDYNLTSFFVKKDNLGNQSKIKTTTSNDDNPAEKQCFLRGKILSRSKQLGTLQCQDGHVVLFFIGRFFIGNEKISSSGDLTRLPLSLLKEANAIALPTSQYEDFGITHEALIAYIGLPTFISNFQSVLDIVHLNPSPKENDILEFLFNISEEKSLLESRIKEDEQHIFQSYNGTFEDLNLEMIRFIFSHDGQRKEICLAKNCLYPKVNLPDLSRCGVLICRQNLVPLVGWLHIHEEVEKHELEILRSFSATSFDEDLKMITLCSDETNIVCECRTDVIHMGKTYRSIGDGSDVLNKHMYFIAETRMVNESGCRSTSHTVLFISSNIYLTKTMHKVMVNTHDCKNCRKKTPCQLGEMKVQASVKHDLEREHIEGNTSQTSEVGPNIECDLRTDVTTAQSSILEELAGKVPKYIAMLDNPDFDMSHISEEWNTVVREVTSCSRGITFLFHGTTCMKMYGTEWKAGNFKKCFANGWYLIECLQDDVTVLINRDQIYTKSHLCFEQNNPESVHTLVLLYETVTAKNMQNLTINGYAVAAWVDNEIADIPFHSCPDHQPTHISVWPYEQEPEFLISSIIMVEVKGLVKPPSTYIFGCNGYMLSIKTSAPECGTLSLQLANKRVLSTITSSSLLNGEQFEDLLGKKCYSIVRSCTTDTGNSFEKNYKSLMIWGIKSSNSFLESNNGGSCCSTAVKFCVDQVIKSSMYITACGSVTGFQKVLHTSSLTRETVLLVELSLPGRGRKVIVSCPASRVIGIAVQDAEKLHDCCLLVPRELFLFIVQERQTTYEKADHEIHNFPRKREQYSSYEGECVPPLVGEESASVKGKGHGHIVETEEIAGDNMVWMQDYKMEIRDSEETYTVEDNRTFASDEEDVYRTDEENKGERNEFLKELDGMEKEIKCSEDKYSECKWKAKKVGNRSVNICIYENEIIFEDCVVALWPKGLSCLYMKLCHVHGIIPPQPRMSLTGRQIAVDDSRTDGTAKVQFRKSEDGAMVEEVEIMEGEIETGMNNYACNGLQWQSMLKEDLSVDNEVRSSDKINFKLTSYIGNRRNVQHTEDDTDISDTNEEDYWSTTDLDYRNSMNESLHINVEGTGSSCERDESDLENELIRAGFSKKDISLSRMLERQLMTEVESSDQLTGVSDSVASYSNMSDISFESGRQGSDIFYGSIPPGVRDHAKMRDRCQDLSTTDKSEHSQESEVLYKTCGHVQSDAAQAVVSFSKDGVKKFVHISKKTFLLGDKKLTKKSSLDKVINANRPIGVYMVQVESTMVLWEHRITYKAIVAFIGKKPSNCDVMINEYLSKKTLLNSSTRLKTETDDGSLKRSEKLKPHGIDQRSLKKMQKHGAIVLEPRGNSTINVTGKVLSHSFAYAFLETKKKNVIFFWHSCTDPEAKHLCDFLTRGEGTVKAEVIPLTEEFQMCGIHVTYVGVLVWCNKAPKQKSALVQDSLKSFPWIIRSLDPLYIHPQVMCKPSQVREGKSGHVTHHSNKLVILECHDQNEDTIYVSFKEEAIHPFFAETYCEYTKTVRLSLNRVVNLFGKDWYCISENTEPHVYNGTYVTQKALLVWPSTSQVKEPLEILSAEHQTFCIVSCRLTFANDDFGVIRLKKKGLALFFKTTCDPSCYSVLKDRCDLQSGVVKLLTPVKIQNDVVHWLALKIWDGEVTDKLLQQMGTSLDVLPWRIWSWNPLLLTRSWKPSSSSSSLSHSSETAHLKDHSLSSYAGIVSTSPQMPSALKTRAISNPAESHESKSDKDSLFHTSGTIIKIMKSSAILECKKKGHGTILVHCKKGDFCVDKVTPQGHNFERWLEPYMSLKFHCLAKKVKPVDVGGTELSYVSSRVWAKTTRTSESAPMLNVRSQSSSTVSIDAECNKGNTVAKAVRKKIEASSTVFKKDDISVWKQGLKHMLKGKVKEVYSTVCEVIGEDGDDKYFVSSSQCFLYGICLSCVELWHVLHTGLCVYYELHKGTHHGMIKHVWIGGIRNKSPSETNQEVEKWCTENMVSVATKDILLLQTGYIDPMLAPVAMDSEEEVEMAIGKPEYCEDW